ncbi:MAG: RES family NAD+ phosphorylase [Candidatus Acidiferrum sp.]
MLPGLSEVLQDDTHRLIPARYTDRDESVLTRLSDDSGELQALFELEGATNDRLLGEAGLLPGISVRELVFGIPYAHIINAAFSHANPLGSRFNESTRGAWYAGFLRATSEREVAYHKGKELQEVRWEEPESFSYVDFLADFRGEFHDIRGNKCFVDCLDKDSYQASQRLASELLDEGSAGVVYPSVRHRGGICIACFRPALVNNVRKGSTISVSFASAFAAPEIREVP